MEKGEKRAKLATASKIIELGQTIEFASEMTELLKETIRAQLPQTG